MNIKILGSGGCVSLPRATCGCRICEEARFKGEPYKRTGCSLFIEDINILIDTPEDINYQINRENIKNIDGIFYSHWDPDHSLGMRILEQLHEGWRYTEIEDSTPIYALEDVMADLLEIKNKFSSYFGYYNSKKLCKLITGNYFEFNKINIKLFSVKTNIVSTIFLISDGNSKVIYAPCDIKPFPIKKEFLNADILIIGNFMPRGAKYTIRNRALYFLDELLEIGKMINAKKVIITHVEEQWGLSFDDYKKIEHNYEGYLEFAYDSMKIELK